MTDAKLADKKGTRGMMITWELAQEKYNISRFYLETMAIMSPWLVDTKKFMVKDIWGEKEGGK